MNRLRFRFRSFVWTALVASCDARPAALVSALTVSATIDGEEPLAGVRVAVAPGNVLGETDSNGRIVTKIEGREGEDVSLLATCPAGYLGPPGPHDLRLSRVRSLGNAAGALVVTVACRPSKRRLVVVVSAPELPDEPLFVNGTALGRTDREGVSHVLTLAAPGEVVTVSVGSSGRLARSFRVADADQVLVLAEPLVPLSPAHSPRARSVEPRARIQRIQ